MQKVENNIEDVSCEDLAGLDYELYFVVLQKLKEKAMEIEKMINETEDISDLEKKLMKVIPTMNLVRTLLKLSSLYQEFHQVGQNPQCELLLTEQKQSEIQVMQ